MCKQLYAVKHFLRDCQYCKYVYGIKNKKRNCYTDFSLCIAILILNIHRHFSNSGIKFNKLKTLKKKWKTIAYLLQCRTILI